MAKEPVTATVTATETVTERGVIAADAPAVKIEEGTEVSERTNVPAKAAVVSKDVHGNKIEEL